jgi:hypothetical protein
VFAIHRHYHLSCDKIIEHVYLILESCQYQVFQKEWRWNTPGVVMENVEWSLVRSIVLQMNQTYTPEKIAEIYLQRRGLKAENDKTD